MFQNDGKHYLFAFAAESRGQKVPIFVPMLVRRLVSGRCSARVDGRVTSSSQRLSCST